MKNKRAAEIEIFDDVTKLLLENELTTEEREIFVAAKKDFDKKVYFPKIINDMAGSLTPLAIQRVLTKNVSPFYLKITSHEFKNKYQGFGYGLGMMFGGGH